MIVHIRAEAEDDLEQAFDYYESQRPGLGQEFLDEYVRGTREVASYPTRWQREPGTTNARRYRLNRFPYALIYQVKDAASTIVAVVHLHRKPGFWRNRLEP